MGLGISSTSSSAIRQACYDSSPAKRRRFIHSIEDGIAQLAHYREFLAIPANAAEAQRKYGIVFGDPGCGLIVGNYENMKIQSLQEARRRFPAFEILDYDTLLQLYLLKRTDVSPESV